MGLYNFKKMFVTAILTGTKTHTIRGDRKYPDKPGNKMHLYTGLRQKGAKLLLVAICTKVQRISISVDGTIWIGDGEDVWTNPLDETEAEQLARRDGFRNRDQMMKFWEGRLPFIGNIYHWKQAADPDPLRHVVRDKSHKRNDQRCEIIGGKTSSRLVQVRFEDGSTAIIGRHLLRRKDCTYVPTTGRPKKE